MFSVPLRRVLIVENPLVFPEGVATAEVIKFAHVNRNKKSKVHLIIFGALIGSIVKLIQAGLFLWDDTFQVASIIFGFIIYFGCNLSPALVAVGYIVQLRVSFLLFLGGILNWWIAIPFFSYFSSINPNESQNPILDAIKVWSDQTRYIGVGAMLMGGLGVCLSLAKPLWRGVKSSFNTYKIIKEHGIQSISRTERDIPIPFIIITVIVLSIPMAIIYSMVTNVWIGICMSAFMILSGFIFSSVGAYMSGIVGSSNNPISGISLGTMIVASGLLLLFLGSNNSTGPPAAILIGAVVCCASSIAGDNMQDLKSGFIVGSTPIVLQIMQFIGVIAPSFVLCPLIGLLIKAYGIGIPDAKHPNALPAPQASLMKAVTHSIFYGEIPYTLVGIGMILAVVVMLIDLVASKSKTNLRVPVLSIALGLYLPLELSVPIFLGGIVAWAGSKTLIHLQCSDRARKLNENNGLLYAAGLITGESLMGIIIAIPIVATGNINIMAVFGQYSHQWPGAICIVLVTLSLYYTVIRHKIFEGFNIQNPSVSTK